ncbi:PREDICTED: uncharacterized protein LOC106751703 [Dinoponera quadriceps]|uniref:Uncharacterized protein LOC106751703 n=1 Tax=Dinoponera quadriceps TaxID=609295 RepID=A0A6P3YB23_DINQU|nr:PREDICTED: uncharacterized protein LOC106751703 [Dinoponera quadriceps]
MIYSERAVIIIFGVILLVTSGSALRCWVCASNVNVMCKDPMNTTDHQATFHTRTCDSGNYGSAKPICRKIVKREYGERVILRQCSTPNHDEVNIDDGPCSSTSQPGNDAIESCHICSSDLCNSATSVPIMGILYASMALFTYNFC